MQADYGHGLRKTHRDSIHASRARESNPDWASCSEGSAVSIEDLKFPGYPPAATEDEIEDCEDDDYSVEVNIQANAPLTSTVSKHAATADFVSASSGCSEATSSNRGSTTSTLSHSECSSSSSESDHSPNLAPLYEHTTPTVLQRHLLPTPFHPLPLAPLLCVADEDNILPLMCSALHQRHALGLAAPVVGILLHRDLSENARCEVLFGWIERYPRDGYELVGTSLYTPQ